MRFKYGGKSRTSSKTDDEELEIGSPSILLRFFGTKNVSMRDGNRPFGYRVIKLATNGGSSYVSSTSCMAVDYLASNLFSVLFT